MRSILLSLSFLAFLTLGSCAHSGHKSCAADKSCCSKGKCDMKAGKCHMKKKGEKCADGSKCTKEKCKLKHKEKKS